jgi:hypothetical protein
MWRRVVWMIDPFEMLMATYLSTRRHDASASNLQSNFPEYLQIQSDVPLQSCDFDQSESL